MRLGGFISAGFLGLLERGVGGLAFFFLCCLICDRRYFSSRRKVAKAARGPPSVHEGVAAPGPPVSNDLGRAGLAGATPTYELSLRGFGR